VDANTNVYVADTDNSTIRKLTQGASGWMVTTIAGLPQNAGTNDGIGSNARFNFPIGLAVDQLGNIFVGDYNTFTIRKLTPVGTNWMVSTIAGTPGVQGEADGTNNTALFTGPYGVAVDAAGSVYVGDGNAQTMRKIIPNGTNWVVLTAPVATRRLAFAGRWRWMRREMFLWRTRATIRFAREFFRNSPRPIPRLILRRRQPENCE
jgi:hypothetical protein